MKIIIRIIAVLVILIAGFIGYKYLTQPELGELPPVPEETSAVTTTEETQSADSGALDEGSNESAATETAETTDPEGATEPVETAETSEDPPEATAPPMDILQIEVAGSTSGLIEIELLSDLAPDHVARIKALAEAGKYDNVVFHRVIDGFMAQTGDVEHGLLGSDNSRVGTGGSDMPNLKAEFSNEAFVTGVVGMARSQSPDSANSQFFIMFDSAPYLNGQYTVVGRVIAGQDVVNAIKKGKESQNGAVTEPDYMKSVRVKSNS